MGWNLQICPQLPTQSFWDTVSSPRDSYTALFLRTWFPRYHRYEKAQDFIVQKCQKHLKWSRENWSLSSSTPPIIEEKWNKHLKKNKKSIVAVSGISVVARLNWWGMLKDFSRALGIVSFGEMVYSNMNLWLTWGCLNHKISWKRNFSFSTTSSFVFGESYLWL